MSVYIIVIIVTKRLHTHLSSMVSDKLSYKMGAGMSSYVQLINDIHWSHQLWQLEG